MLKQLKANYEPAEIQSIVNAKVTDKKLSNGHIISTDLLGLCLESRFRSGAYFLIYECNVAATEEMKDWAGMPDHSALSQIKTHNCSKLSLNGIGSEYGDM